MPHFNPAQFPNSDSFLPTFFVFNRFPKDVGLAILEHCSPFDLTQLSLTSRFFHSFILVHKHLWTAAQSNLARGKCPCLPPPPAVDATGNYSQSAYAFWLFGGGTCTFCETWTDSQLLHFLFRFRSCSVTCKSLLFSDASLYVDKAKKYDNSSWGKWLPRVKNNVNGVPVNVYSNRAIKYAGREWQQARDIDAGNSRRDPQGIPWRTVNLLRSEYVLRARSREALTQNASDLDAWKKAYLAEQALVTQANFAFFKIMANVEDRKVQAVMRTPTAARLALAFNRDLSLVTHTVWVHHRQLILTELKYMREGVLPRGVNAQPNDKIRCSYCPRLIKVKGIADHLIDKHKDQNSDTIPGVRPREEKHCADCPGSKRVYTLRGMKDHQLNKHNNPNYPPVK
ncbi:hypothetical protein FB451DRAFT_1559262 [Mycena latifolia]|nr:hypothetical protein FB451DRAFT_1559262 [Mycena latifolia]